ncbi:MAG: hypothetical protein HY892_08675 [Deltaproteobacteria bacterium]|nr:hypothetical protein [Deltaproteobacteria bacterium]
MIQAFSSKEFTLIDRALEISEDVSCNYYHISASNWKKYGFEISHLAQLSREEITDQGLAQISRYVRPPEHLLPGDYPRDYYRVCLQDHNILQLIEREKEVELFPLMIYILTHELVHIIRFRKFQQRFDVSPEEKNVEERKVHQATFDILKPLRKINLEPVLDSYFGHRCPRYIC